MSWLIPSTAMTASAIPSSESLSHTTPAMPRRTCVGKGYQTLSLLHETLTFSCLALFLCTLDKAGSSTKFLGGDTRVQISPVDKLHQDQENYRYLVGRLPLVTGLSLWTPWKLYLWSHCNGHEFLCSMEPSTPWHILHLPTVSFPRTALLRTALGRFCGAQRSAAGPTSTG